MKKILVTGGSGFIGRNIKESISDRYEIIAPSSKDLNLLDELKVEEHIKNGKYDIVIHSAIWNGSRNTRKELSLVLENNLKMFYSLERCSADYGKMIYYGTGAEYDRDHWIPKMKEEYFDTCIPRDDYGFSKYIMSKYAENSRNIYNLRLFGVFGKYEDWEIRFISNACCKAIYDFPISIKQNTFFDYMHIDDLVKITEWFIKHSPSEKVFNVCTGKTHSLLILAKKVLAISGKTLDICISKKGLGNECSGNNSKLLKEIGNYQFKDLDNSIKELYLWYLSQKKRIDKGKLLADK